MNNSFGGTDRFHFNFFSRLIKSITFTVKYLKSFFFSFSFCYLLIVVENHNRNSIGLSVCRFCWLDFDNFVMSMGSMYFCHTVCMIVSNMMWFALVFQNKKRREKRKKIKAFYYYLSLVCIWINIDDCECTLHQQRRYKLFCVKIAR